MTRFAMNAQDTEASSRRASDRPAEHKVQGSNRHTARQSLQEATEASQERDDREAIGRGEDEGMTVAAEETAARSVARPTGPSLSTALDQPDAKTPLVSSHPYNLGGHPDAIAER